MDRPSQNRLKCPLMAFTLLTIKVFLQLHLCAQILSILKILAKRILAIRNGRPKRARRERNEYTSVCLGECRFFIRFRYEAILTQRLTRDAKNWNLMKASERVRKFKIGETPSNLSTHDLHQMLWQKFCNEKSCSEQVCRTLANVDDECWVSAILHLKLQISSDRFGESLSEESKCRPNDVL